MGVGVRVFGFECGRIVEGGGRVSGGLEFFFVEAGLFSGFGLVVESFYLFIVYRVSAL